MSKEPELKLRQYYFAKVPVVAFRIAGLDHGAYALYCRLAEHVQTDLSEGPAKAMQLLQVNQGLISFRRDYPKYGFKSHMGMIRAAKALRMAGFISLEQVRTYGTIVTVHPLENIPFVVSNSYFVKENLLQAGEENYPLKSVTYEPLSIGGWYKVLQVLLQVKEANHSLFKGVFNQFCETFVTSFVTEELKERIYKEFRKNEKSKNRNEKGRVKTSASGRPQDASEPLAGRWPYETSSDALAGASVNFIGKEGAPSSGALEQVQNVVPIGDPRIAAIFANLKTIAGKGKGGEKSEKGDLFYQESSSDNIYYVNSCG